MIQVQPWDFVFWPPGISKVMRSERSPIRTIQRRTLPVRASVHWRIPMTSPFRRGRLMASISANSFARSGSSFSRRRRSASHRARFAFLELSEVQDLPRLLRSIRFLDKGVIIPCSGKERRTRPHLAIFGGVRRYRWQSQEEFHRPLPQRFQLSHRPSSRMPQPASGCLGSCRGIAFHPSDADAHSRIFHRRGARRYAPQRVCRSGSQ